MSRYQLIQPDCQPTYEELKLRETAAWLTPALDCQPTYEELKLNPTTRFINRPYNCQPTYEELKRFCLFGLRILRASIASLPMRNWNYRSTSSKTNKQFPLPAYLWGIETLFFWLSYFVVPELPAFLWGIETWKRCGRLAEKIKIASLPMMNWNVFVGWDNFPSNQNCQPTYEELKLFLLNYGKQKKKRLPAYLWGIETYKQLYPSWHTVPSIASLPMRHFIETNSLNFNKIV